MRIGFITVGDTARLTGGYLYHREVFARLRAAGHSIDEIVASEADEVAQQVAAPELDRQVDPHSYNALVIDALARIAVAPWADRWRATRPLVALVHELPSVAAGPGAQAAELAFEQPLLRADRLIAVSDDGAVILAGRGVARERIIVASGGYDRFMVGNRRRMGEGGSIPSTVHRPPSRPIVALCVAQWIARKGILELVQAWNVTERPGARLELVGETMADPAYAAALRAAIDAVPQANIVVRGQLSDAELAVAYASADLFVLPSNYEGYGIAFAEALSYGLPVLGCAVGPLPALVGPAAGLLVPPGDGPTLAVALGRLLSDEALRARMGAAALERTRSLPTWQSTAQNFLAALQAAIGGRNG